MVKRRQDGGKVATEEAQNDIGLDAEQLDMSEEDNDDDIGASEDEDEQDDVRDFEGESSDDGWADVEGEGDSEEDLDSEEEDGQGEGDGDEDGDGDGDGDDEDEDDTVESDDSAEAAAGSLIKAIEAAAGSQRATLEGDTREGEGDEGPATSGRAENGERTEVDPYENHPHEEGSDSSDEERPHRNTVGSIPLEWYKAEDHIGYGLDGEKILRKQRGDLLERLLARNDDPGALRTVYDEYNDEEIELSREELRMLMRIRKGHFPHVEVDPYQPYVDWFSGDVQIHPLSSAPEPKRRFAPSKWEEKKIVKLVRAMRKGWIRPKEEKRRSEEEEEEGPPLYLMWGDDSQSSSRTAAGLSFLPAPKAKLPGHEESYNPPAEYVPTEEERAALELLDEADRPALVPSSFDALRKVPAYSRFIKERFERCLDLYLCPRSRRKRHVSDARTLLPKLPKPRDLRPFPTTVCLEYLGHSGKVHALAPDASGQWLLSGGEDGTMRVWETSTGRCQRQWDLGEPVRSVAWCPAPELHLASCVAASRTVLMPTGLGGQQRTMATASALQQAAAAAGSAQSASGSSWVARDDGGLEITHRHQLRYVTWHCRGDYFASVAPAGNTAAVVVHQLSKGQSQQPFKRTKGKVLRVQFHPQKPFFFVATLNSVRVYNLAKQALAKKLLGSSGVVTCMDVHPSGDHLLVGAQDKRLAWYDLDLSSKPYKGLRYHTASVRGTCFHPRYPLFASCSDDGTTHVFHGMVYADLMTNPLIVPVKILRGHTITDREGVLDCKFHPTQPWLFTAGSDSRILLYCDL